jgi:hypothetical protein
MFGTSWLIYVETLAGFIHSKFPCGDVGQRDQTIFVFLLEWVTRTSTLKLAGEAPLDQAIALKTYVDDCDKLIGQVGKREGKESDSLGACIAKTAASAKALLARCLRLHRALFMTMLVNKELKGKDHSFLPEDLASLSVLLDTDWTMEISNLESDEADLIAFFPKMQLFESAHSLLNEDSELQKQDADLLAGVNQSCTNFMKAYTSGLEKAVSATQESMLPALDRFVEKFEDVEKCVMNDWAMDSVEWIFKDEAEDEVQKDIDEFKGCRREILHLVERIKTCTKHFSTTRSDDLKEVLKKCEAFEKEAQTKADKGAFLASLILFCHCAMQENSEDVKNVESFVQKTFGLTLDKMPEILRVKVQESEEQTKKQNKPSDKNGKDAKDTDKKEKKTRRTKNVKRSLRNDPSNT